MNKQTALFLVLLRKHNKWITSRELKKEFTWKSVWSTIQRLKKLGNVIEVRVSEEHPYCKEYRLVLPKPTLWYRFKSWLRSLFIDM